VSNGVARPVGSLFFPLDQKLQLGTEGYSPRLLQKVVRQAGRVSFQEASDDLQELAEFKVSATHVCRLSERIGREWVAERDKDVQAFRDNQLACDYTEPPLVAAVMLDGGRVQTRCADNGRGVAEPCWQENKVACCLTLASTPCAQDPQPEPPAKFLDPPRVARLTAELKSRGRPAARATESASAAPRRPRRQKKKRPDRPRKLVRTVVATMADSETFGWQMAAEVQRRGLDRAARKACVCDGQKYNWTLFELHLLPWGFVGILDFLHLLAYLYSAAQASERRAPAAGWRRYEQWLRWAWAGKVKELLAALRGATQQLGSPPKDAAEDDPRRIVADTLGYVENNRTRMNYPHYRQLGLPISSAPVESVIKQINRRMKGSEKFWLRGGAEALLQVRAAYLSEDGRAERYWSRPRPYARAAGGGRLRPVAKAH
jgi:hypothetical protein